MNSQPTRLYSLQYLRFIAAIAVVYSHTVQQHDVYSHWLPYYGDIGVDIFFVISGFILVWISKGSDTPVEFFSRRVRRIVPLYWFFTLLMAVLLLVMPTVFRGTDIELGALLNSLFFIPYWNSGYTDKVWPLVVPGWSLNYEMYFYLLFALSLWLPSAFRVLFTSFIIVVVLIVANLAPTGTAIQDFMKQSIVLEFVLGMLLALAYKKLPHLSNSFGSLLLGLGVLFLVLQPLLTDVTIPRVIQFGVPALMIVAGTLYCQFGENRLGLLLGDSSYALYLSHGFVLGGLRIAIPVGTDGSPLAAWGYLIIAMITCIVAGVAVHLIVENWLLQRERLDWLRRRSLWRIAVSNSGIK